MPLFVSFGVLGGGRQGECGPELCVRQLRVCGSQLAVCLVSLFVAVSLVRVVIICLASTHTALVSSPSLTVVHLSTYIHTAMKSSRVCWRPGPSGFSRNKYTRQQALLPVIGDAATAHGLASTSEAIWIERTHR